MKLSVVIPTYDRAAQIGRALSSIKAPGAAAAGHSIEVIVVDDGDDGTKKIVSDFRTARQELECVYIHPEERVGVNYARNRGAECATADWISFLDSDDEYVPGGLDTILSTLPAIASDVSFVGFMTMREVSGVMEPRGYDVGGTWKTYRPSYEDIVMKIKINGDIHYCVRKSVFTAGSGFPEDIQGFESFFFADMAKRGMKFLYVNEVVDRRYTDGFEHMGSYEIWPRQYARYYRMFVAEHRDILKRYPGRLSSLYTGIAGCYLRVFNPRALYWLAKAALYRIWIWFERSIASA